MRLMLMRFLLVCLLVCWGQGAWALKFFNEGKCAYSEEALIDPDKLINLRLSGDRNCDELLAKEDPYPVVKFPNFPEIRWPIHPERATRELAKRYGSRVKESDFFELTGGVYREYKILGKRSVPPIDGHETLEYTVELLYVLQGWVPVPGIYPDGLVPVCERNTVKLYAVKTDRGWYTVIHPGIGDKHDPNYEATRKRTWGRDTIERDIARELAVINKCKDHLN